MKTNFALILILFLFINSGCTSQAPEAPEIPSSTPELTVKKFLNASLSRKDSEAYNFLTTRDRTAISRDVYRPELAKDPFLALMPRRVSFTLKKTLSDGERAFVDVEISAPDTSAMLDGLYSLVRKYELKTEEDHRELKEKIVRIFNSNEIPFRTQLVTFDLRKEPEGWRIFSDLEAREKHKEPLPINETGERAVKQTEAPRKKPVLHKATESYLKELRIVNVNVTESQRGNLGVFGEIENLGKKTISRLAIKISYLDRNNKTIHTETRYPVDISSKELRSRMPLKPRARKRFGYTVTYEPPDWSRKVSIRVTRYEFAQKRKR